MPFGVSTSAISRETSNSVNVAEKLDNHGDVVEMTTYGGKSTITEETYSTTFTNEAVNGQQGSSVISEHSLIESNTDYRRERQTIITAITPTGS